MPAKQLGGEGVKVGGIAIETRVGDTVRSILNGIEYKVKKIVKSMALLESRDGKNQILTELENQTLFYKKREEKSYDSGYDKFPPRHSPFLIKAV